MDNFSMAMLGKNASFRSLNTNKKLARSIEKISASLSVFRNSDWDKQPSKLLCRNTSIGPRSSIATSLFLHCWFCTQLMQLYRFQIALHYAIRWMLGLIVLLWSTLSNAESPFGITILLLLQRTLCGTLLWEKRSLVQIMTTKKHICI